MIITRPSFRWITAGVWLMPVSFAATALCLLGAYWRELCLRWQSREIGLLPKTSVGWAWWLVLGLGGVSTALSVHPLESLPGWLGGLGYAISFIVATWTVNTPGRLRQLHRSLFWLGVAMAAFGLVVYANDWHFTWQHSSTLAIEIGTADRRINSLMFHPNLFAGFLVLSLSAGLGLFHQVADWGRKVGYGLGLGASALALLLTASRAGWIGAFVLLVGFGLAVDRRWLLALVGAVAGAFACFPGLMMARLAALSADNPAFDKYRLYAWQATEKMVMERPLTGWGPNMWSVVYPNFRLAEETRHLPHAHNYFLHVASEFGLPVVFALFAIVGIVCVRGLRDTRHTQYRAPVVATVCGVVGYCLLNLFDYTLSEGRNAMAFFLLVGGVEAARRMALADRPPELRHVVPAAPAPLSEDPRK